MPFRQHFSSWRKAGSIRRHKGLGGWLQRVAYRVALKARADNLRRRQCEANTARSAVAEPSSDDLSWGEMRAILHAELATLSESFRAPLVLCYLEGLTQEEAARQLGWTAATVKGRLQRGRDKLRRRLERRGIALTAALDAALTAQTLAETAVRSAGLLTRTSTTTAATALAREFLRPLLPLKLVMLSGLMLSMGVGIGGLALHSPSEPRPSGSAPSPAKPAEKQPEPRAALDAHGDPLPPGAVARLGTLRFRHEREANALAFSPDGKILAGSCNGRIVLWNAATGRALRRLDIVARGLDTRPFDFSPDGTLLAAISIDDKYKIVFCKVATGKRIRTMSMPPVEVGESPPILRFAPDGKKLAVTTGLDKFAVLDSSSGKVIRTMGGHRASIYGLAFAPDGKTLAVATVNPSLQLWDVETGKRRWGIEQKPKDVFAHTVAFTPDGRLVAAGWWDRIGVYDTATGKEMTCLEVKMQSINGLAFMPDGKTVVAAGQDGKCCASGTWPRKNYSSRWAVRALAEDWLCRRTVKTAALASTLRAIRLWDIESGEELFTQFGGHNAHVHGVAFSPDGQTLFSGGENQQILLWRAKDWRQTRQFQGNALSLSLSPDGKRLASVPYDKAIRVWDVVGGKDVYQLKLPDAETIRGAYFASGGAVLVSLDQMRLAEGAVSMPPDRLGYIHRPTAAPPEAVRRQSGVLRRGAGRTNGFSRQLRR